MSPGTRDFGFLLSLSSFKTPSSVRSGSGLEKVDGMVLVSSAGYSFEILLKKVATSSAISPSLMSGYRDRKEVWRTKQEVPRWKCTSQSRNEPREEEKKK